MPKRTTKLPSPNDWNLDADLAFLKRYKRLVASAPPAALRRMDQYLTGILAATRTADVETSIVAAAPNGAAPGGNWVSGAIEP
jgi:hypothetical protein